MTLEQAIAFAALVHEGQKDKVGATYILHPLRVMNRMNTLAERRVAVLHDVVEDCGVTLDQLRGLKVPEREVLAVEALTRGKRESYTKFIERAGRNRLAKRVKLADLADNTEPARLAQVDPATRRRLLRKYGKALRALKPS